MLPIFRYYFGRYFPMPTKSFDPWFYSFFVWSTSLWWRDSSFSDRQQRIGVERTMHYSACSLFKIFQGRPRTISNIIVLWPFTSELFLRVSHKLHLWSRLETQLVLKAWARAHNISLALDYQVVEVWKIEEVSGFNGKTQTWQSTLIHIDYQHDY